MAPIANRVDLDFSSLTNEELEQMLTDYGVEVGPINAFTRRTYERKLYKLKTGQGAPPAVPHDPAADFDEEDDEVQIRRLQTRQSPQASPQKPQTQTRQRKEVQESYNYSSTPRLESRPDLSASRKVTSIYSTPRSQTRPQPAQKDPSSGSRGIPLTVKLVAVAIVVVLVYLIWCNMEPSAVSNIPHIQNKVEV